MISTILDTRENATQAGHALASTGVTWTDPVEAAALREALATRKVENVMLVSAFMAAAALAQMVGSATGNAHTALLFVEPDTATLAVVDSADGSITDVHKELISGDDTVAELAGMVAGLDRLEPHPQHLFLVGSGVDVATLKPQLEAVTLLPVSAPEEPETALAWGAALASASAPLFASSTAALAYAQDPATGEVDPYAVSPGYLAVPDVPPGTELGEDDLAYSADPDEEAQAETTVLDLDDAEHRERRPLLLVGSVLAVVVVAAVLALEVSLALGIRPSAVALLPRPLQNLLVPTQQAPAPAPAPASAPAPQVNHLQAPVAAPQPMHAPIPAPAPAAHPPVPAAPVIAPAPGRAAGASRGAPCARAGPAAVADSRRPAGAGQPSSFEPAGVDSGALPLVAAGACVGTASGQRSVAAGAGSPARTGATGGAPSRLLNTRSTSRLINTRCTCRRRKARYRLGAPSFRYRCRPPSLRCTCNPRRPRGVREACQLLNPPRVREACQVLERPEVRVCRVRRRRGFLACRLPELHRQALKPRKPMRRPSTGRRTTPLTTTTRATAASAASAAATKVAETPAASAALAAATALAVSVALVAASVVAVASAEVADMAEAAGTGEVVRSANRG